MENVLNNVYTIKEASTLWEIDDSYLRHDITRGKFKENEIRKSAGTWLVLKSAMIRLYGELQTIPSLYTIGYEGLNQLEFANILKKNNIASLCDVREIPLSRKKGFSKTSLNEFLHRNNIEYIHMKELGSPKTIRQKLHEQHDYKLFFDSYRNYLNSNTEAVEFLKKNIMNNPRKNICLMCFEKNPQECHRSIIVEKIIQTASTTIIPINL